MTTIDKRVEQTWFELSALLPDIPSTWDITMVNSACRDILAAAFRHAVEDEIRACAQTAENYDQGSWRCDASCPANIAAEIEARLSEVK